MRIRNIKSKIFKIFHSRLSRQTKSLTNQISFSFFVVRTIFVNLIISCSRDTLLLESLIVIYFFIYFFETYFDYIFETSFDKKTKNNKIESIFINFDNLTNILNKTIKFFCIYDKLFIH